jgi:hypothetical protein
MIEKPAAIREKGVTSAQYRLRSSGAQTNNNVWFDERQFRFQPRLARHRFTRGWLLVDSPFAAFFKFEVLHGVSDIHLRSFDPSVCQGMIEQFAGRPDKRAAGNVFVIARLLADHNDPRLGWTLS